MHFRLAGSRRMSRKVLKFNWSLACGKRHLHSDDRLSLRSLVSFYGPFDFLPVLPLFSAPMTPHSYLDNLLYQLEDVRKLLIQVEENSPEWTKFDRLEDKLLAELANHSLED